MVGLEFNWSKIKEIKHIKIKDETKGMLFLKKIR